MPDKSGTSPMAGSPEESGKVSICWTSVGGPVGPPRMLLPPDEGAVLDGTGCDARSGDAAAVLLREATGWLVLKSRMVFARGASKGKSGCTIRGASTRAGLNHSATSFRVTPGHLAV